MRFCSLSAEEYHGVLSPISFLGGSSTDKLRLKTQFSGRMMKLLKVELLEKEELFGLNWRESAER